MWQSLVEVHLVTREIVVKLVSQWVRNRDEISASCWPSCVKCCESVGYHAISLVTVQCCIAVHPLNVAAAADDDRDHNDDANDDCNVVPFHHTRYNCCLWNLGIFLFHVYLRLILPMLLTPFVCL